MSLHAVARLVLLIAPVAVFPGERAPVWPRAAESTAIVEALSPVAAHHFALRRCALESWSAYHQASTSPFARRVSLDPTGTVEITLKPPGADIRIVRATPGTLWFALGLREGDQLHQVNGVAPADSPERWMDLSWKLLARPSTLEELVLEFEREGQRLPPLHVSIVHGPCSSHPR